MEHQRRSPGASAAHMAAIFAAIKKRKQLEAALAGAKIPQRSDGQDISAEVYLEFKRLDTNKTDNIDAVELKEGLRTLKLEVSAEQCLSLIHVYSEDGDTTLSLEEFDYLVEAMKGYQKRKRLEGEPFLKNSILGKGKPLPCQTQVRRWYTWSPCVALVAFIIIANFVINIVQAEIDPDSLNLMYGETWDVLDTTFNVIFLVELLVNMYGYGGPVLAFWSDAWNVFDFIIVTVGVVFVSGVEMGNLSKLKLLRAFRVFRIFKRIKCARGSAQRTRPSCRSRLRRPLPQASRRPGKPWSPGPLRSPMALRGPRPLPSSLLIRPDRLSCLSYASPLSSAGHSRS